MAKYIGRLFVYLIFLVALGVVSTPRASGQTGPVIIRPTTFYRFQISFSDGGYLLTSNFQEGAANGWGFNPILFPAFNGVGIYVPPPGYTPDPAAGLVPLHRWRVVQNGWRQYFYYSVGYANLGGDYTYQGVVGYVFPPGRTTFTQPGVGTFPLFQVSIWYSQDLGYWYGYGHQDFGDPIEAPPNRSGARAYGDHGVLAAMPPSKQDLVFPDPLPLNPDVYNVRFNPPPPPPPPPPPGSCNVPQGIRNRCAQLGGFWDDESCTCQY